MPTWVPSVPTLGRQGRGVQRLGVAGTGPPVSTVAPFVSGTAETGETLSCNGGSWTGAPTIVLTYQWKRDGVNIGSATASTYLLVELDEGASILCAVTGTNGSGNATANSNTVVPSSGGLEFTPLESATSLASDTLLYSEGIAA